MSSLVVSTASSPTLSGPPALAVSDPLIEVFGLLLEAHSRLVARLDRDLMEGAGVSLQTFEVLIRLARTPGETLAAGELGRAVALSSGGATRLTDRLVAAGLVTRAADVEDRRIVGVSLTVEGRAALLAALPIHIEGLQRHLADPLDPGELIDLEHVMRSVRDHFDAVELPAE